LLLRQAVGFCLRIRACSLSRSRRTRRMTETAKPCGQPCPMILRPFNSAKASYSENKISAPVPGASSLKNPKLASSASLERSFRPMERSRSSSRLMRVRSSEGGFSSFGTNIWAIASSTWLRLYDITQPLVFSQLPRSTATLAAPGPRGGKVGRRPCFRLPIGPSNPARRRSCT
jgi:hypothetical protein